MDRDTQSINSTFKPNLIMENEKIAQSLTKHTTNDLQTLIDIAAEAKRAQRSEQYYLQVAADLDNTVHSLKNEREQLLKRNNELIAQLTQLQIKAKRQKR